jgi:CBS domain-containing protein
MLVNELMTRKVLALSPDTSIVEAGRQLLDAGVTAAPVLDESGAIVGIVSRRDLLVDREIQDPRAHLKPAHSDPFDPPHSVADVMTRAVITLPVGADDAEAAHLMLHQRIASIPVVDHGLLAGMISVTDILRSHTRTDDEIATALRERFFAYGEDHPLAEVSVDDGVVTITGAADPLTARIAEAVAETTEGVDRVHLG